MSTEYHEERDEALAGAVRHVLWHNAQRHVGEEALVHRYRVAHLVSATPSFLEQLGRADARGGWFAQIVEEQDFLGRDQGWWELVLYLSSGKYQVVEERNVSLSFAQQRAIAQDLLHLSAQIEGEANRFVLDRIFKLETVESMDDVTFVFSAVLCLSQFAGRKQPWLEYMMALTCFARGDVKGCRRSLNEAWYGARYARPESERKRLRRLVAEARAQLRQYADEELAWLYDERVGPRHKLPLLCQVPRTRSPFFVGREDLLAGLHEAFFSVHEPPRGAICALTGLAGMGKTQIALEYVYRHLDEYDYIFWVNGGDREHLADAFESIADSLPLRRRARGDLSQLLRNIHGWMYEARRWLLVIDDMPDEGIGAFWPNASRGHILLTTRFRHIHYPATWEVDGLSCEAGANLLLRRAGYMPGEDGSGVWDHDRALARALADHMGGMPLALDQFGEWVEQQGQLLRDAQEAYTHRCSGVLAERGRYAFGHPGAVLPTVWGEISRLEARNPAAADLLKLCAFLADAPVPENLVVSGASLVVPSLQETRRSKVALDLLCGDLRAYHLGDRDAKEEVLMIPRIVRLAVCAGMSQEEGNEWKRRAVLTVVKGIQENHLPNLPLTYRVHAEVCRSFLRQPVLGLSGRAQLWKCLKQASI